MLILKIHHYFNQASRTFIKQTSKAHHGVCCDQLWFGYFYDQIFVELELQVKHFK